MNAILAIGRRELSAYFATPVGWICLTGFTFLAGVFFVSDMSWYDANYRDAVMNPSLADQLNVNDAFIVPWFGQLAVIALLAAPALSMRLIAEDRRQRNIELLLTSPITSIEIAVGKLLGGLGFSAVLTASTLPGIWILYRFGNPDTGVVLANYLALFLVMSTLMAIGLFFSSLTENQIVAFFLAFGTGLFLWIVGWMVNSDEGTLSTLLRYLTMSIHVEDMGKGLIHAKNIAYFLSFIGFFTFATAQRVEALRWR